MIRKMSQNDLDAVNAIEIQAFQDPWSKQDFINELESNPYSCIYVKEINGELLIFSGSCMYVLKGTAENISDSNGIFVGTSVSMKIPLYDTTKVLVCDKKSKQITSINLDQI